MKLGLQRRFRAQVPVTLAAVSIGTLTAFATIPQWGAVGAAVALLATALVQAAGGLIVVIDAVKDRDWNTSNSATCNRLHPAKELAVLRGADDV